MRRSLLQLLVKCFIMRTAMRIKLTVIICNHYMILMPLKNQQT